MKKLFIFALMLVGVLSFKGIYITAKTNEYSEILTFFNEYSQLEETWKNGKLIRGDDLYTSNDEKIGYMYRVYNKGIQHGYILYLDDFGIVEATFDGSDLASEINGKVYYMIPGMFMSKMDYDEIINERIFDNEDMNTLITSVNPLNSIISSTGLEVIGDPYDAENFDIDDEYNYFITTDHVPNLSSNYSSYYTSMSGKYYIENVPDYNNFPDGPINNGCFPTSAAMLIAYYDNNGFNGFTEIEGIWWWQKFPLVHADDDDDLVDELIIEMSDYLGNCGDDDGENTLDYDECHGVSTAQGAAGLSNFLDDEGYDQWNAIIGDFSLGHSEYDQLISLGNPSIITIIDHPTYGSGHAVIGMGHYVAYMSQPGVIIHDDFATTGTEIWLSYNVVSLFTFIYND